MKDMLRKIWLSEEYINVQVQRKMSEDDEISYKVKLMDYFDYEFSMEEINKLDTSLKEIARSSSLSDFMSSRLTNSHDSDYQDHAKALTSFFTHLLNDPECYDEKIYKFFGKCPLLVHLPQI